jgi:hypothetical protein
VKTMADEFTEFDAESATEQDLDQYGSTYLSAADVGDKKMKAKIVKVRKGEMRTDDGKKKMKLILFLDGFDKAMVLNATNKDVLVDKLGRNPANWGGATIGLFVDPNVMYQGKRTKGLRLRVLLPPARPATTAKPKPAAPPSEDWAEEAPESDWEKEST